MTWLEAMARPLLRRRPDEIERHARRFPVRDPNARERIARLGRAFLDGYNTMLETDGAERCAEQIRRAGAAVEPHWRPFFFEGAAMGHLARGTISREFGRDSAESRMLGIDPAYLYLYYVGFGFWYGFRHPHAPGRVLELARHVDPFYLPLCFDGFGFKLGFFDLARGRDRRRSFDRCPRDGRAWLHQGLGRASFFTCMEDEGAYEALLAEHAAHRLDLEQGRALAVGFTGYDRPATLLAHLEAAPDPERRGARLVGLSWALAARRRCDPDGFTGHIRDPRLQTIAAASERTRPLATDYADWQSRTRTELEREPILAG